MVVVVVFVLCNVLAMVSNMLDAFGVEAVPVTQVSNLLVSINSSINLFIYCGFGKKFISELKRLMKKCCTGMTNCNSHSSAIPTENNPKQRVLYSKYRQTVTLQVEACEKTEMCQSVVNTKQKQDV